MDRELDELISRLKRADVPGPLMSGFDDDLFQRIAARPARVSARGAALPLQASAIAIAFAIGLLVGLRSPAPAPPAQTLLAEAMGP